MSNDVAAPGRASSAPGGRIPILYLAPWVDYGGTDTATIDWFRRIDRERFAPYLITTQPSLNRRLSEIYPYAEEVWTLPEFLGGQHLPSFIFDVIHTRGVRIVHVMNARIGFELIADMGCLPEPPGVVVQLHVEEQDRSGYVRLVTTRYGNLVDGFSVVSESLAEAVQEYGAPCDRISVIPLGVDAEERFDPDRTQPIEGLSPDSFHVLYAGRLTAQKDPLLMVEVLRRVVETHERVLVHIVGEGELEPEVRERVRAAGLERHVAFHPMTEDIAPWYAGCDLLLMTSLFEGVPCVVYEAMAMRLPILAPALPGNRELMGETAGVLIEPRDDAGAYASALVRLIENPGEREALARSGRERILEGFTLKRMADGHAELYEKVLQAVARRRPRSRGAERNGSSPSTPTRATSTPSGPPPMASPPTPLRFTTRPSRRRPLVSVIVPCFNHGRYLHDCVDSILEQDYPELEIVVVDDASTEASTIEMLSEVEADARVSVLRQARNSGPSAARNRAIAASRGRYVLPVDADNLLAPGAISSMVEQLQGTGERVGFIYPNCQYFGTRDDYFQPSSYNPFLLMEGNYCDTCSLIDREVFEAGLGYAEDIEFGHEDWDFALKLAAHGVMGEPARDRTLLYRKHGFTRSDMVDYNNGSFFKEIVDRHPSLFGRGDADARYDRYRSPTIEIKARWAPALSVLVTTPFNLEESRGRALLSGFDRQSCRDLEVILEIPTPADTASSTPLRRLPPGLCESAVERLQEGLRIARGRYVLAVGDEIAEMLQEAEFVERLLRTMIASPRLEAIAFTDAGDHGHFPHRLLRSGEVSTPAHALLWDQSVEKRLPRALRLEEGIQIESLARAMSVAGVGLQWRHATTERPPSANGTAGWFEPTVRHAEREPHRRLERTKMLWTLPAIPSLPWDAVGRWLGLRSWIPPETTLLCRHREIGGERRVVRANSAPPPGYSLEFELGAIQRFAPPGTARLVVDSDGIPRTVPRGSERAEEDEELGHLELAPFPMLLSLERAELPDGSVTLVVSEHDPVRDTAVRLEHLGYIEAYPNEPAFPPDERLHDHGRVGLLRCLDQRGRRHFYRVAKAGSTEAAGEKTVGELGALHLTADPGSIAVRIDPSGRVSTDLYRPGRPAPSVPQLARWAGAPARWSRFGRYRGRVRAIARRGAEAALIGITARRGGVKDTTSHGDGGIVGYLYHDGGSGRRALFAATHPVTGDQLLTSHRLEATDMGYVDVVRLGFMLEEAPVTGVNAMRRVAVPWASRFGLEARKL
jgi:glycosyltransferase involved in cell wall biosynthesis